MKDYILQNTTIWSFPDRGSWATHKGDYRGNWSPHIPRNLILKYTKLNDTILDCFLGSGTTLIEAKLLGRNGIGIDINEKAIDISRSRLNFDGDVNTSQLLINCDARDILCINDSTIDLICLHPPYANIIKYSDDINGDLSLLDYDTFLLEMQKVAKESYRCLKPNHFIAIMIGDIRFKGNVRPLGFELMNIFVQSGFTLKEIIIKEQHNCKSTKYWQNAKRNFYLLAHEYIFIMYK